MDGALASTMALVPISQSSSVSQMGGSQNAYRPFRRVAPSVVRGAVNMRL